MRFLVLLLVLPLVAGCLPSAGPQAGQVVARAGSGPAPFDVIDLDAGLAAAVSARPAASFAASFGGRGSGGGGAANLVIGPGDRVAVTIYEAAAGGLFSGESGSLGAGTKSVTLPPQPVSRAGTISVPYAGQLQAAGLTQGELEDRIEAALKDKAIEPQVIVTLAEGVSTAVTVAGEVRQPGRIPLDLGGDRVLDVIAAAGGTQAPDYDSFVRLTRGTASAEVSLARIVADPAQNIYLRPDDQLYVKTDPQVFTAFGATLRNASFPFGAERLTLAEAIGQAGGLNDVRADPTGVFVFRYEDPALYAMIGGRRAGAETMAAGAGPGVPVIYRLDLDEPASYFAAQRFEMRDNDIVYVSNAPATDLSKFLGVLSGGLGPAATAAAINYNLTRN